ncbi:MAG: hypothetical protein Q8L44_12645 [Sulfuritalea sp.]|nr:hypothetical protein [Sulfuritalea sp.]
MKLSNSHLISAAMIVALIATAIIGHHFSPLLLPKADVAGMPQPGCDLQQRACSATLPNGGRIEFSITPRPIPFLQALRTEVTVSGIEASKVVVDFAGETMNMGYNRSELTASGSGHYSGETSLPVCVSGGMTWVATVIIETDRQRIAVPYRFDVGH